MKVYRALKMILAGWIVCLAVFGCSGEPEKPEEEKWEGDSMKKGNRESHCRKDKNMLKVMIIGCPGSGKSTFARKLRDETGLPLYYLDMLWHKPDRTTASREEFDAKLNEIVQKDRWIIDGNYQRTLGMRLRECDTVFLMDCPLDICLAGAESRIGRQREDLPWFETEFDEEFKQWIIDFPQNELPGIYKMINRYKDEKDIVIFKTREETERYLQKISHNNLSP